MPVDFFVPGLVKIGGGAVAEVPAVIVALGVSRPLLVADGFLLETGLAGRIVDDLRREGFDVEVFSDVQPDPTTESLAIALRSVRSHEADSIIALGGGSAIDSAKALAVLAKYDGPMRDLKAPVRYDGEALPVIAIPTTAGTGSEATMFTVITDSETHEKMLCAGSSYLPAAAVVDYETTLSMPARLTADTGIDALTHAIEAYVSKKANTLSDMFALEAIGRIGRVLRTAYHEPADRHAREEMMVAATVAGIAFSNSSVCLVHGMSRPLGARFGFAHGMANAMLLAEVTSFSASAAPSRYADCARALGVAPAAGTDVEAVDALIAEIRTLVVELEVPTPESRGIALADWEAALPTMAEQALASGSPANNPRVPSIEQIQDVYRACYRR
jgi:alcohol dehydrogenase class IV